MKKKQVIAIAAALAAVLLMSTAVYAIGNMGAENNQDQEENCIQAPPGAYTFNRHVCAQLIVTP